MKLKEICGAALVPQTTRENDAWLHVTPSWEYRTLVPKQSY